MDSTNSADWDLTPTVYQATTIAHGHLLHFKQVWKADGYSLGDLLYSLPLAPCQSKQVVTIDWERREVAQRTESTTEAERLAATLARDRDINEVASTVLSESMRAGSGSHSGSVAGGFGIGAIIGPVGGLLGVAGGSSNASSHAWQNSSRRLSAQSLQHLSDQTSQAAAAVRSRRSTVVAEATQGETVGVTSEVITNHNHAHAMTVEYFEVLRHFVVSNQLVGVRECLFVPLLMGPFTISKALRWKEPLAAVVPVELRRGFRALERIDDEYVHSDLPLGSYADDAVTHLEGDIRLNILIARPPDPDGERDLQALTTADISDDWRLFGDVVGLSKLDVYRMHRRTPGYFDRTLAPTLARDVLGRIQIRAHLDGQMASVPLAMDVTVATPYRSQPYGGLRGVSITLRLNPTTGTPRNLARRRITHLGILPPQQPLGGGTGLPMGSRAVVTAASVRYRTNHYAGTMVGSRDRTDDLIDDTVLLATDLSPEELRNPRMEDAEIASRLLRHLNDHLESYHRQMWLNMDTERRYMLLDGFLGPGSERSLASLVENQLIGIVGNSLVLPVAPGFLLDPLLRESLSTDATNAPLPLADRDAAAELLRLYQPATPEPPRRLSLPTKGVFAEAILGSCNSAEVIDETRFWRWSEEPCSDVPTPILPVSTDTRRTEPQSTQPTGFSSPIVAMQTAPSAPDPTGLATLLTAIGRPDLFRDLSGLNQNQLNAIAGLQTALSTAQGFGQSAAALATTGAQIRARQNQLNSIRDAARQRLISPEQTARLYESALTGAPPTPSRAEQASDASTATGHKLRAVHQAFQDAQISAERENDLASRALHKLVSDDPGTSAADLENLASSARASGTNLRLENATGGRLEATLASYDPAVEQPFRAMRLLGSWIGLWNFPNDDFGRWPPSWFVRARDKTAATYSGDVPTSFTGASRFWPLQLIERATSFDTNMDLYIVRITAFPTENGVQLDHRTLSERIRLQLNNFLDTGLGEFSPADDEERVIWESQDAKGAIISIDARGPDNFSVMCTEHYSGDESAGWIFSTMAVGPSGRHALSGNRAFGVRNVQGAWEFYTQAVDRWEGAFSTLTGGIGAYVQGHLWNSLMSGVENFVRNNGGQASTAPPVRRSVPWSALEPLFSRRSIGLGTI
jgi:hypothetical protein